MIGDDVECISWLEKKLGNKFDMTSSGHYSKYLGIQFVHQKYGLFFHQTNYTFNILEEFGMTDCNPLEDSFATKSQVMQGHEFLSNRSATLSTDGW
jgi:hypothetical protein